MLADAVIPIGRVSNEAATLQQTELPWFQMFPSPCRCVRGLQGAGVKVLADIVINHRCAAQQDEQGVWNVFGGKLAWNADAVRVHSHHLDVSM